LSDLIDTLDEFLAEYGEDVILRRTTSGTNTDVTCRASVRPVSAEMLAAGIKQDNSVVVLSPTEIISTGWPGDMSATIDSRVPTIGDKVVIAGRVRQIEFSAPIYVAGELVRIDLRVTG
jgi:hypothetical protein